MKTTDELLDLCKKMHCEVTFRGDVPEGDHETWTIVEYCFDFAWVWKPVIGEGATLEEAYEDFSDNMIARYETGEE